MGFTKFGSPMQARSNVAEAMSIGAGARVIAGSGKNGTVLESSGLTLIVMFDGDDNPTTVSSTAVRRTN